MINLSNFGQLIQHIDCDDERGEPQFLGIAEFRKFWYPPFIVQKEQISCAV